MLVARHRRARPVPDELDRVGARHPDRRPPAALVPFGRRVGVVEPAPVRRRPVAHRPSPSAVPAAARAAARVAVRDPSRTVVPGDEQRDRQGAEELVEAGLPRLERPIAQRAAPAPGRRVRQRHGVLLPAAVAGEREREPRRDDDDARLVVHGAGERERVAGRGGQRAVARRRAGERLGELAPDAQRPRRDEQLLVGEVVRLGAVVERGEARVERVVVDRTAVVGIDQRDDRHLAALVDVGDAGEGQLHELGAERRRADRLGGQREPVGVRGDHLGVDHGAAREREHRLLVVRVRLRPGRVRLRLAHRLDQVGLEALDRDRPASVVHVDPFGPSGRCVRARRPRSRLLAARRLPDDVLVGPGAGERLPQEVLDAPVDERRAELGRRRAHARHVERPVVRALGEHVQPHAHVLAPLRVVRREPGHRERGVIERAGGERVQLHRADREPLGGSADLVQAGQVGPAVERRVLDRLRHDRTAGLLEADDELGAARLVGASGGTHLVTLQEGGEHVERLVPVLGEAGAGALHAGLERGLHARLHALARNEVVAVALGLDEELDEAVAERVRGVVAEPDVVVAEGGGEGRQALDLGLQGALDDLALGLLDEGVDRVVARQVPHHARQLALARGVDEDAVHAPHRVVARRAGRRPVLGQLLVGGEDLLDDDPGVVRLLGEALEVGLRGGEPVGVIDAQPVDRAALDQPDDERVRRVEHLGELDADGGERVDVEEAAVVELLGGDLPPRDAVVLTIEELGERQVLRALAHRQHVIEVAEHGARRLLARDGLGGERDLVRGQHRADASPEDRHQERPVPGGPVPGRPVDVEPVRVGRVGPLGEHRPERPVVVGGHGDGHVVRDDVEDEPEARRVRRGGQPLERLLPAEIRRHPLVIDDVVAVHRPGGRGEDRGQVQVGDAEAREVGHARRRVVEGEPRVQLQPVGRDRHRPPGRRTAQPRPVALVAPVPGGSGHGVGGRRAHDTSRGVTRASSSRGLTNTIELLADTSSVSPVRIVLPGSRL